MNAKYNMIEELRNNLSEYEINMVTRNNYLEVREIFTSNLEFCLLSEGREGGAEDAYLEIDEGPPGFSLDNKYFVSLRKDGKVIGILDFLDGFPEPDCVWIGLLMIHSDMHDKGIGREIVKALLKAAEDSGHKRIQLGVIEENVKALKFWRKMGFEKIREKKMERERLGESTIVVMEREVGKTLVVYHSKYGHTKRYAQWLAEELNADICNGKNLKSNMLNNYSTVLFGSSLYAGTNKAAQLLVKHFEQIKDKKVVLFTCGLADVSSKSNITGINKALDKVITPEIRNRIKIFHVRGGVDYDHLSFLHKIMMKGLYSQLSKKPESELTDENRDFLATYGQNIDFSDKKMIEPIIQYCLQ